MSAPIELARQTLQRLATTPTDFVALASAAYNLGLVIRYGDVRQYDAEPPNRCLNNSFLKAL